MGEIKKRIDELEEERNQKLRHDVLERELNRHKAISACKSNEGNFCPKIY